MFTLDPAFGRSSHPVVDLGLCTARLQDDARWPWLVLIPRIDRAREIGDLSPFDRVRLVQEIVMAGEAVRAIGAAVEVPVEKLNIGMLGNITPQLHAHVVGRKPGDENWPGPVWGFGEPTPYTTAALRTALAAAEKVLRA
jgi:diadenosine tetraphosphate (Ap4A) HIT family hydrolase